MSQSKAGKIAERDPAAASCVAQELEPLERLCVRLQSPERDGHQVIVGPLNLRRTDRGEEKPSRIEHRRFFADRYEADNKVALKRQLPHVAEQMRFARSESAPNESSLGLTRDFEPLSAPPQEVEERIDQSAVMLAKQPDSGPVGNAGAQSFNGAARRDLREFVHQAGSTIDWDLGSIRTKAASGLSRSVATTSSSTRAFSAL